MVPARGDRRRRLLDRRGAVPARDGGSPMSGHVLTFGETMGLFRTTEFGDLADVSGASIGTGGADSNVAIGLARLGVESVWVGRVGADGLGRRVVRDIRGEGVDVRADRRSRRADRPDGQGEAHPAHDQGLLLPRGQRRQPALHPATSLRNWSQAASLVHVTGITASISASARQARPRGDRARRAIGCTCLVRREPPAVAVAGLTIRPSCTARSRHARTSSSPAKTKRRSSPGLPRTIRSRSGGPLARPAVGIAVVKRGAAGSIARGRTGCRSSARRSRYLSSIPSAPATPSSRASCRPISAARAWPRACIFATVAGAFACMGPGRLGEHAADRRHLDARR